MPTTVVTPGLSEPVVRLGAPPIPAPARVTADRVGAVLQPVVAYRESLGRRAYVIAHPAVRESPRQWPIAMDVIGRALPGLELLSYEGADLRQDEGSREGYEQRWPQLLATLGAVVSVPSTLGGTSALGRFAFIELESAVADGLPAFIYDRAIQTLHAASDCRCAGSICAAIPSATNGGGQMPEQGSTCRSSSPRTAAPVLLRKRQPSKPWGSPHLMQEISCLRETAGNHGGAAKRGRRRARGMTGRVAWSWC